MDCSPTGSSVHGFPSKNTGVGCPFLLQGIFPTQGLNLCLLHWRHALSQWATREAPIAEQRAVKAAGKETTCDCAHTHRGFAQDSSAPPTKMVLREALLNLAFLLHCLCFLNSRSFPLSLNSLSLLKSRPQRNLIGKSLMCKLKF